MCAPAVASQRSGRDAAGGVSAAEPSARAEEICSFLICTLVSPKVRTSCTGAERVSSPPALAADSPTVSTAGAGAAPPWPYEATRNWRVPASVV